jgi:hypothetical protein
MAADDEAQDAVRRILTERPPEELPSGAEARLRNRLDRETPTKPVARSARATTVQKKKSKRAAR